MLLFRLTEKPLGDYTEAKVFGTSLFSITEMARTIHQKNPP